MSVAKARRIIVDSRAIVCPSSYRDVEFKDGWADAAKFLPVPFDLMRMQLTNGKYISGWWTGQMWEGLKLEKHHIVKYWKRQINP